jgi:hypothetical protein
MVLSAFTRFLFAAILGAGMLFVSAEPGAAQRNDGFFFLRDPFGQTHRPPPPVLPREQLPRRQAAPPEPTGGTIYGSSDAADRHRPTQAEQYVVVMGDSLADQLAQGLPMRFSKSGRRSPSSRRRAAAVDSCAPISMTGRPRRRA